MVAVSWARIAMAEEEERRRESVRKVSWVREFLKVERRL